MRIIFKIARAELRSLFFSPIAWAVIVIFFVVTAIPLFGMLKMAVMFEENIREVTPDWAGWQMPLTSTAFGNVFDTVIKYLYIFVPLLTMGAINKEINAGTIRLLHSSPVRARHIVLGKYAGLMAFLFTFILVIGLFSVAGYIAITHAEYKIFFTALFGFFLLTAAYAAIGLFISSLTNYQIVAGVATFVVFFILHMMAKVWQQYDLIRDLTYFLSIDGRAKVFSKGLVTTKDVCYFLLIVALFLGFSLIRLRGMKEPGSGRHTFFRYAGMLALVLVPGYLSSRPGYIGYLDVTRNQINTIHPVTQKVVKALGDEPLTVTLYTNLFDPKHKHGLPQNRNVYVWDFWDRYVRFHPETRLKYVYYYDIKDSDSNQFRRRYPKKTMHEVAEDLARASGTSITLFKTPKEIRSLIDLEDEDKRMVMQLEYKGKKTWLRIYDNNSWPWPEEAHVSAALSRLMCDTMPLFMFTSGHYERSPYKQGEREYSGSTLRKSSPTALLNLGADVDTINLREQDLPAHTSVLVVADPRSALQPGESEKIVQYLNKGGNAIFLGEPGKQDMLNPVLQSIGVRLEPGAIVHLNDQEMPHILDPLITPAGGRMAGERALYRFQLDTSLKLPVRQPGAAHIHFETASGFSAVPVLKIAGNDSYWIENGMLVVDSAAPRFIEAEGDVRKSDYITAITMWRSINGKEQRIVVSGDADFMSDFRGAGGAFGNAFYSWAMHNAFPLYTNKPLPTDDRFAIGAKTANTLFVVYLFVIPGCILLLGIVILVRRNRK